MTSSDRRRAGGGRWAPDALLGGSRASCTPVFNPTSWSADRPPRRFTLLATPVVEQHEQPLGRDAAQPLQAPAADERADSGTSDVPAGQDASDARVAQPIEVPATRSEPDAGQRQRMIDEAHARGFREGEAMALRRHQALETAQPLDTLVRRMAAAVEAMAGDSQQLFLPLKRLAVHLAMELVRCELRIAPAAIESLVRHVLAEFDGRIAGISVSLHPDDLALVRQAGIDFGPDVVLQADETLTRGSVDARTEDSRVQDLIEHRLSALSETLLQSPQAAGLDPASDEASADAAQLAGKTTLIDPEDER